MSETIDGTRVTGLAHRTLWLVRLRWLFVAGLLVTVVLAPPVVGVELEIPALLGIALIVFAYNIPFHVYAQTLVRAATRGDPPGNLPRAFANVQISADLITLTALLHYSGGVENPFAYFYVFHMIFASILLSVWASLLQATLTIVLYGGMLFLEYKGIIDHHHLKGYAPVGGEELAHDPRVVGASVAVLGGTLYIAVFLASSIAQQLRRRERQVVAARDSLEEKSALLSEANRNLAELEQKKSRFMRVAAHQLRSPLAAIRSCLKVVIDGFLKDDPEREKDMLGRADVRLQTLVDLVNELLALSRIRDVGFTDEDKSDVCIDEVVHTVVELQNASAEQKDVTVDVDARASQVVVRADKNAILDVVANLVSNAIKYTDPGGQVSVRTYEEAGRVYCEVKDSGIGIPKEEMTHLFEEFFRASNARKRQKEGSGLGLSIVREILRNHDGDIAAESKVDEGTLFRFHLPCQTAPA